MCFFQNELRHIPPHLRKEYKKSKKELATLSREERRELQKDVGISMGWEPFDENDFMESERFHGYNDKD